MKTYGRPFYEPGSVYTDNHDNIIVILCRLHIVILDVGHVEKCQYMTSCGEVRVGNLHPQLRSKIE